MKDTVINLLNITLTKNKKQYLRLAFLMSITNFVKSCLYEKFISTTLTTNITSDNIDNISSYRNFIASNPSYEDELAQFLYNNQANNVWQDDLIANMSLVQILYSLKSNSSYVQSRSQLVYPMLYSAFKNLLDEPINNEVVLTADSDAAVIIISNILSTRTNISYEEMLVRNKLELWYSMCNETGNFQRCLFDLLHQSPLKAAIIICIALQAGNYFCSISDFWEIYQKHISLLADESFNKFSILTEYLKTLSINELNNFFKNDLNTLRLDNFPELQDALLNAKHDNGNLIIDKNTKIKYLILKPQLYYGFENLLDEPRDGQVVLNTTNNQSLLIVANLFSNRNNIEQEQLNARNQLDQYLSELSDNFNSRGNYLYSLLNVNPLKAAIIICKALKAGNYFCYISDFWDIYQNQILCLENPQFDKFSIFTNFLKNLSIDERTNCKDFIEENFSLACFEMKLDFAKALLDTKDNNGQFILNHDSDEFLYNHTVEMAGLM